MGKTRVMETTIAAIKSELDKICDVITSTMGPGGRLVGIQASFQQIYQTTRDLSKDGAVMYRDAMLTKDGVTVARFMKTIGGSPLAQFVAKLVCEAADKTMKEVGDGTTTVSLLVKEIYSQVGEFIFKELDSYEDSSEVQVNFHEIHKGMQAAVADVEKKINSIKRSVKTKDGWHKGYLKGIAAISCNNDKQLGELIAEAVAGVGLTGSVTIHDSSTGVEYFERKEGYTYEGCVFSKSQLFDQQSVILDKPMCLIVNKKIESIEQLNPVLSAWQHKCLADGSVYQIKGRNGQPLNRMGRPLVLFVSEVEGSAFTTIQLNLSIGTHPVYLVSMAETGDRRAALLSDLQKVTGSHQVFSVMEGADLLRFGKDFDGDGTQEFGECERIVLTKDKTMLFPTKESKWRMEAQSQSLQKIEKETGIEDSFINERISRLDCGIVNIYLHANSVVELGDRRELADDAVRAVFSAMRHGVVAGGGRALQWIQYNWAEEVVEKSDSWLLGFNAVVFILSKPMGKILENCYIKNVGSIKESLESRTRSFGFNPLSGKIEDFFVKGILDPAAMPVTALQNAVSVVGQLLKMDYFLDVEN